MKLQNWGITNNDTGYTAPELIIYKAVGNVYGHPTRPDGQYIHTSGIVEIDLKKRYIITRSGNKYILGRMNPEYAKYVRDNKKGK